MTDTADLEHFDNDPDLNATSEEVAMSDMQTLTKLGESAVEELRHAGVKGMKWGVRKTEADGSPRQRGKIRRGMTKLSDASSAGNKVMNRRDIEKPPVLTDERLWEARQNAASRIQDAALDINKSPKFKGKDIKYDAPLRAAYSKEVEKVAAKIYEEEISAAYGKAVVDGVVLVAKAAYDYKNRKVETHAEWGEKNPEKAKELKDLVNGIKEENTRRAQHADDPSDDIFELEFEYDELGQIETTAIVGGVAKHYGVKGMQWGVRKSDSRSGSKATDVVVTQKKAGKYAKATGGKGHEITDDAATALAARQKARASTTDALSNQELQAAVNRMNLEQQYKRLEFESDRRSAGRRFIEGFLGNKRYNGEKIKYKDIHEERGEAAANAADALRKTYVKTATGQ